MNEEKPSSSERHTDNRLPGIDDAYILDSASGIYKRKSEKRENRLDYDDKGRIRISVARDWVPIVLSAITVAIVFLYTYYAKRTVEVAERTVEVMKESEERVWMRIGDNKITLTTPPIFERIRSCGYGHGCLDGSMMEIDFPLVIENVGSRIATRYAVWSDLIADTKGPAMAPWGKWWEPTCKTASTNMKASQVPIPWEPMLPGVVHRNEEALLSFVPSATQHISEVYIVACVAYREMNGDEQFSAVLYCQSELDGKPTKVLTDPDMFYSVTKQFWACNHEAN